MDKARQIAAIVRSMDYDETMEFVSGLREELLRTLKHRRADDIDFAAVFHAWAGTR